MSYLDYKFKKQENIDKRDDVFNNTFELMKKYYKEQKLSVLSTIRKQYKITPARLKQGNSQETQNIREFTLYMMVFYSRDSLEKIANEFDNITLKDLSLIQTNQSLHQKYDQQVRKFLEYYKEGWISNQIQTTAFSEEFSMLLEES